MKIEVKEPGLGCVRPLFKFELFDENENLLYDTDFKYSVDSELIDSLCGNGCESMEDEILKENEIIRKKAIKLYKACEAKNETKIEKTRKELGEELIDFDNKRIEPLIVVQFCNFFGEVRGIKLEAKDVQYRPAFY